ncbi:MAG: hypothetical protein ACLUTA_17365 [Blautia wexlerae]
MGIQAAIELAENLKPEDQGQGDHCKNSLSKEFEERSGSICTEDNKNLNRVFRETRRNQNGTPGLCSGAVFAQ